MARLRVRDLRLLRQRVGNPLPRAEEHGLSLDGSFADYVKAYGRYVVKVPDGVDPVDAAPLTCAGVTTYKAIKVAGTRPSDLVAIFGVGGLGHLAIQYATIAGGRVVAVDLVDEKLELARELGAEFTVNAAKQDPAEFIRQLGGADQAIALAVSPASFEQAYRSLRRGGTLVFVALPAENHIELPIFETVLNGITVVGSIVGTRVDLREVFELHAAGKTRVIRETRSIGEVNEAIADVEAGRVPARIVFTPEPQLARLERSNARGPRTRTRAPHGRVLPSPFTTVRYPEALAWGSHVVLSSPASGTRYERLRSPWPRTSSPPRSTHDDSSLSSGGSGSTR